MGETIGKTMIKSDVQETLGSIPPYICKVIPDDDGDSVSLYIPRSKDQPQVQPPVEDFFETVLTCFAQARQTIQRNTPGSAVGSFGLNRLIEAIPASVGERFQAHGVRSVLNIQAVTSLDHLITKGLDKSRRFDSIALSSPFEASFALNAFQAFTDDGIIVLPEIDHHFIEEGQAINSVRYVILGEEYNCCVNLIKDRYKDSGVVIMTWDEALTDLCRIAGLQDEDIPSGELDNPVVLFTSRVSKNRISGNVQEGPAPTLDVVTDPDEKW
jgi:hypothetical protein